MANELKTTKLVLIGGEPIRLPIRAADPVTDLSEGQLYYNSTSQSVKIYDGSTWADVSGAVAASEVTYDNGASGLAATDAQAAIDEVENLVQEIDQDVGDLVTLTGVSANETDLGLFTGDIITDNATIQVALQDLESGIEGNTSTIDDHIANASGAHASSAITYDTGTSGLAATDVQAAIDEVEGRLDTAESDIVTAQSDATQALTDAADLATLSGVAANDTDLGTFTGTTITDSSTIKAALQELETAVESAGANPAAADVSYDNATSGLTATDAQAAIDEVEGRLDTAESDIITAQGDATQALSDAADAQADVNDLVTLSGVAANATDLGTFTGAIIPDSSTVKAALQSLETEFANLPNPITYEGTWAASTNTPTLEDGTGDVGDLYQVSDAGTVDFGSGNITFAAGDKVVYNGSIYEKWDMTDAVTSVNGQSGTVSLDSDDISEGSTNLYHTAARAQSAVITQVITNGVTDKAPSEDAVFDALATKADNDLSNLASTALNTDIIPDTDATLDLGTAALSFDNAFVKTLNADNDALVLKGASVQRADAADSGLIEMRYFHGVSLAANTASFTTISGLSFANATYEGVELEFKIKEATTNKVRIGKMFVAADGTNVSYSPQYTETGVLGDTSDGEGLKLQAVLSGGNILIQFKDTHATNACLINVDVKLFKV